MKKYFVSFVLILVLVFFMIDFFSPVVLAEDSAECKSGDCSCSCSGTLCYCIASSGSCSCYCAWGGSSSCGIIEIEQIP